MGPKKNQGKGKGKKKSDKTEDIDEEKQAILQKIKDQILVNQMNELSKLKQLTEKADSTNKEIRDEMRQVERDRSDIIAFLRRRLGEKCEEEGELMEVNNALIQEKASEKREFSEAVKVQEQHFNEMNENFTAEIKALNSRLGNIEEYKEQRDVLLDKNNKMESYLVTMEVRAQAIEKEYEKADLIDKDRMRREMEEKFEKFSVDFQRATKARIAMATQNVIKENIAINNELSLLIASWQKLHDGNETLRTSIRYLSNDIATESDMREKLMKKNVAQAEMIDRLAYEYMKIDEFHKEADQLRRILSNLQSSIEQKEKSKERAQEVAAQIIRNKKALEDQVSTLRANLERMTANHERNAALMKKARVELEDSGLPDKKKAPNIYNEDLQRKLDLLFIRLEDLFSEDWVLDVTATELKEASVDTVVGPFGYENARVADRREYEAEESVSTAEVQRKTLNTL